MKIDYVRFPKGSFLPEYEDFLKEIRGTYAYCEYINLTDNIIRNIHRYNLGEVAIGLNKYENILTELQLDIIKSKYSEEIGVNIELPNKVYGKRL